MSKHPANAPSAVAASVIAFLTASSCALAVNVTANVAPFNSRLSVVVAVPKSDEAQTCLITSEIGIAAVPVCVRTTLAIC